MQEKNSISLRRRLARTALPWISAVVNRVGGLKPIEYIERMMALLQGKGSSTAWDISREVCATLRFVDSGAPVFVDVGARIGEWAKRVASARRDYAHLVLVEPQPRAMAILKQLALPRVSYVEAAVADVPGRATLYTANSSEPWGASSLFKRKDSYFRGIEQREISVTVRTLDEIFATLGLAVVDFMKMDIEGAELSALNGARQSFSTGLIRSVSFEFGSGNINSRTFVRDFWEFFSEYRYDLHRVLPDGRSVPITVYDEHIEYFRAASNFIACKQN